MGNTNLNTNPADDIINALVPHAPQPHPRPDARKKTKAGICIALAAYGAQDTYMFVEEDEHRVYRDIRKEWLSKRYTTTYCELDVEKTIHKSSLSINVLKTCDLINEVDLVLTNISMESIESVQYEIGGQRIDIIDLDPVLLDALAAVHGGRRPWTRKAVDVVHGQGKLKERHFIPLMLGGLHSWNLLPLIALRNHDVVVRISFRCSDFEIGVEQSVDLYGNVYFLDTPMRQKLQVPQCMGIAQCNWGACEKSFTVRLHLNHSVTAIMFWGFDKNKVTNVRLSLNGSAFYDDALEPLERAKESRLGGPLDACFIFFSCSSTPVWSDMQSTINFSRIDHAILEITSSEELGPADRVHVRAITLQPLRISQGMAGLAFSK